MPTHFLAAFQQAKVTACGPAAEPEMCRRYIPLSSSSQMLATAMGSQPECTHGHTDRQTLEVQQGRCPAGTSKLLYFTCTVFMSTFKRRIVQSARSTGSSEQALGFPPSWSVLRARGDVDMSSRSAGGGSFRKLQICQCQGLEHTAQKTQAVEGLVQLMLRYPSN